MTGRLLFCCEKWCDANPAMGLTNNYHNLFGSLEHSLNVPFDVLHIDEAAVQHGIHIDKILVKAVEKLKPSAIIFSLLGRSNMNPSIDTYIQLKGRGEYLCFMWPDADREWALGEINKIGQLADLHVSWDNAGTLEGVDNHMSLWVPQDDKLYYDQKEKKIDVGFFGSLRYRERATYIQHLMNRGIQVYVRGGQREEKLPPTLYAEYIRSCKIGLNFPWSPFLNTDQCKGRVYEIIASNSMLLERKNEATAKILRPGIDYVEFTDPDNLIDKINYYLNNEEERVKIADSGYRTFHSKYSATKFWEAVIGRMREQGIDL